MDKKCSIHNSDELPMVEISSEIDQWYQVGESFWIRRTTATDYFSAQVFPVVEGAYLCYLHAVCSKAYDSQQVESYKKNAEHIPENVPQDICYVYPIALSLDIDCADEKFLASSDVQKSKWLNKLGIWENEK